MPRLLETYARVTWQIWQIEPLAKATWQIEPLAKATWQMKPLAKVTVMVLGDALDVR